MAELAAGRPVVRCRECGHPLVDRDARLRELGADCALKRGLRDVRGPGRFEVEQETLPEA
ncbi:DUF6011 domain-containing protein [Streptomyces sp. NBC_01476]|uniref:DUF6011 domain-containing protein n=1 Tax=Streptomyces sp. NBC_01476 TaxID=2903881 RepID=UPI002E36277C|nr:DUF6011 domain-containing protein [Streptomyces sp. NBC_01476]